jgi:predicted Abi (CAAX) family protease
MIHQKLFSVMSLRVTHFSEAWTGYGVSTRFVFFSELFLHCAALYVLDCHIILKASLSLWSISHEIGHGCKIVD